MRNVGQRDGSSLRRVAAAAVLVLTAAMLTALPGGAATQGPAWPTYRGQAESGQQAEADVPLHPGVRWSTPHSEAGDWFPDGNGWVLHGGDHVLFKAYEPGNSEHRAVVALDAATGSFAWATDELVLTNHSTPFCGPVIAPDATVWGVRSVPGSAGSAEELVGLHPDTGQVVRQWANAGDLSCHELIVTAEGGLVLDGYLSYDGGHGENVLAAIDPSSGAELWRFDPAAGCSVPVPRRQAGPAGPATTLYAFQTCTTPEVEQLVAIDTATGQVRASFDRAMSDGTLTWVGHADGGMLVGEETASDDRGWLVGISDDGAATLTLEWRHQLRGPEDTSGMEPQAGPCLYEACGPGDGFVVGPGVLTVRGPVLDGGQRVNGYFQLDLGDGSIRWSHTTEELGLSKDIVEGLPMATDRSGRLVLTLADPYGGDSAPEERTVTLSADGVVSSDQDGDGIPEYGWQSPRTYSIVPGYSGGGETIYREGKPFYPPETQLYYVGAPDRAGDLYGTGSAVFTENAYVAGYYFSLTDVAPGDDRNDPVDDGGGGGSTDGGSTDGGATGGSTDGSGAPPVVRYAGENRYETAAMTVSDRFGSGVAQVYVATGANFPDALAAAALAGRDGGPVLLVTRDQVPSEVGSALEQLQPGAITVVGGEAVVSDAVMQQLAAYTSGDVQRVAGQSRFDTAAKLALRYGDQPPVYVATGLNFPDALAGTVPAILERGPILLVERDRIPPETADVLGQLLPRSITILGGEAVVSVQVEQQLQAYSTGGVDRLWGPDRYTTAVRVSQEVFGGAPRIYVATATNFPDALAGGAPAGIEGVPLLLVPSTGVVPAVVLDEVSRLQASSLVVLGGFNAVSQEVVDQLASRLLG